MSRRSTPERIAAAWEAGARAWLGGLGLLPARVDGLMAAWALEAEDRGLTTARAGLLGSGAAVARGACPLKAQLSAIERSQD